MQGFDPKGFGTRLRQAIRDRGWDVKKLQTEVRSKYGAITGSSYGNVWSYVNGQASVEPRRKLVEAMATLLEVTPEYLLFDGPKTEVQAAMQAKARAKEPNVYDKIVAAIPELDTLDDSVSSALMAYLERWLTAHLPIESRVDEDDLVRYARSVWDYLEEPVQRWSVLIGKEIPVDPNRMGDYAMAILHALNLSLHVVAPAGITHDDIQGWPSLQTEEEDTDA